LLSKGELMLLYAIYDCIGNTQWGRVHPGITSLRAPLEA